MFFYFFFCNLIAFVIPDFVIKLEIPPLYPISCNLSHLIHYCFMHLLAHSNEVLNSRTSLNGYTAILYLENAHMSSEQIKWTIYPMD